MYVVKKWPFSVSTKLGEDQVVLRGREASNGLLLPDRLLHNPIVTDPIIGPRTMEQLESAVRATEIELEADVLHKLDVIFPGPGGEAPMAYAW